MTTFPVQLARRPRTQSATRRFLTALSPAMEIVAASITATRNAESAHGADARRELLDRFTAEIPRSAA